MAKKKKDSQTEHRICIDCIHYHACQLWNIGSMRNTVADSCAVYERIKDSQAYYLGVLDGRSEKFKAW